MLIANAAYRRAIVRMCAEQIRVIEGRLDQACGTRFDQQLQSCEDLGTVAKLLLVLQRRTELKGAESGWLEELSQLSPAEQDERAVELVCHPCLLTPQPATTAAPMRSLGATHSRAHSPHRRGFSSTGLTPSSV
jgi:hypothetical protein